LWTDTNTDCKGKLAHDAALAFKDGQDPDGHGLKPSDFHLKELVKMFNEWVTSGPNRVIASQSGFNRLFAAWILDEDLPWVTGETPLLAEIFRYLDVNFQLPSDTTACNQLAHIFAELLGKVVQELAVRTTSVYYPHRSPLINISQSIKSKIAYD
jgi:hypothetical protein